MSIKLSSTCIEFIESMGQYYVADKLKVTQGAISHWVNGHCSPSTSNLMAIVKLLNKEKYLKRSDYNLGDLICDK